MKTNRVTEYKVCKALAEGVDRTVSALVTATARPESEVLDVLVKLYPDQFGTPGVNIPYRTTATVAELVAYVKTWRHYQDVGIDAVLEFKHYPQACGCMGPQDGNPLCGCAMQGELERQKTAVAAALLAEQIGVE